MTERAARASIAGGVLLGVAVLLDLRPVLAIGAIGSAVGLAWLARRASLWRTFLSPLGAFLAMYLTLTLGGMAWLYVTYGASLLALTVVWLTLVGVVLGAWLARGQLNVHETSAVTLARGFVPGYALLTLGVLVIAIYALVIRPDIPLLVLLTHPGQWDLINKSRFDYTTGQSGFSILSQSFQNGLPYVATFAFIAFRATRVRWWGAIAAGLFAFDAVALVLSTQRGLVLWLVLMFVIAADAKTRRVSLRWVAAFGAAVIDVLFGILALRTAQPGEPAGSAIATTIVGGVDRLFLEQNRVAAFVVSLPTGLGRYLATDLHPIYNRLILLSPKPDVGFSGMVYNLMFPAAAIQGTAPSLFTTELFADFSWPGVAVGGLVLGAVLIRLEGWLRRANDVADLTFLVAMTVALARLQQVDVLSATLDFGIFGYGLCFLWLRGTRLAWLRLRDRSRRRRGVELDPAGGGDRPVDPPSVPS